MGLENRHYNSNNSKVHTGTENHVIKCKHMCVMVEPKLKNTGLSKFTAYDETTEFQR